MHVGRHAVPVQRQLASPAHSVADERCEQLCVHCLSVELHTQPVLGALHWFWLLYASLHESAHALLTQRHSGFVWQSAWAVTELHSA